MSSPPTSHLIGLSIQPTHPDDREGMLAVARSLPLRFTPRGVRHMEIDLTFQDGFVALFEGEVIGFLTFFVNDGIVNIAWMGVREEVHRKGIGRKLLGEVVRICRERGVERVFVSTLGDSVEYEPYERTRAFYRGVGFKDHARIQQDDPECPESLILSLSIDPNMPNDSIK